ncbi:MAG: hypothetical protein HKP61_07170 [Dactylosporangium sp.]|nr:hypothetical protein [Dactylosporangium sp.]NNJ60723.1 hypothetical protein [Dactylosporangium sp.]
MAASTNDDTYGNGYRENAARKYDDTANTKPAEQWPINRRRHPSTTRTDIHITSIETTTMTPEQEHEAVQALAALLSRFWQHHPNAST